ncbi:RagB/SusD family nutrient uptake outer membrane protein [Dyadobacter sp. CY261]|uniref:RagB/SusD family nutrient uptake outer membrane protein n=1 Tax=Dyadobacter sp. CY261 TaxID=2907203 RepID=UPI001F339E83|nr:RagB/SusD family nutrient uptake outer membrane protein [Dyadobacter sp. CY261]MCF0070151.1 RagB/SusD family nutrient uptake outer membrane protein [Dyadobacter sp. CY261]
MNISRHIKTGLMLMALGFTSCEDKLLNLTPDSVLTPTNFYKNAADINQAVLGIYNSLQTRRQTDYLLMEVPADNLYMSANTTIAGSNDVDFLTVNADNALTAAFWNTTYNGVFRANAVLLNIDTPTNYTAGQKDQYIGEAKFMRALYYFDLVRVFGAVPKVVDKISIPEAAALPKATEEEIYSLIIEDLTDAAAKLPARKSTATGRASKGAAMALLGKVYVYRQDWANAKTQLEKVINELDYKLVADFASLWKLETEDNDEVIFTVKYVDGTNGQSLSTSYTPNGGLVGIADRGAETSLPSWSLLKKYEEADKRKAATVKEWWTSPAQPNAEPIYYPYVSKYAVKHSYGASGIDIPVLRYADIVLLYAETLFKQGDKANALVQLNKIRERAFGNAAHNYKGTETADLMDLILNERQLELAYEHERWFDLVRSGKYLTVMKQEERLYNYAAKTPVVVELAPKDFMKVYPIPQAQIDLSSGLKQNNGY